MAEASATLSSRKRLSVSAVALPGALVLSAFFMALAMASDTRWWLGWVALLPVFYAIRVLRPLPAFGAGALWGAGLFASLVVLGSSTFAPGALSLVLLTVVPGAYAAAASAMTRQIGFSPYLLALGWMGVELALSPLGLNHGLLAGTQGDAQFLQLVGHFAGSAIIGFLVAYFNAVLFTVLERVPLRGSSQLRLTVAICGVRRLILADIPSYLSNLLRPSQPRAPPCA